ncbi:MAG: symmetrical bis(5'-nucleosyl)-tetraphosphatase [Idiomarina sp.]|nr:symmetrical bis(5'-nucleosyl)-tetraphosphatase [Idiomarina sp.]
MARYIVGDIHGCIEELQQALALVEFSSGRDDLWSVGDLVGRGPHSLATLQYLYSLGDAFQCSLGNHDLHLLAVANGIRPTSAKDNTQQVVESSEADKLLRWLRHQPLLLTESDDYLVVHAGLHPDWTPPQAVGYAQEIEHVLRSNDWIQLLEQMYGNKPDEWDSSLSGMDRYRFIINTLTRMRYLTPEKRLELSWKESPKAQAPTALEPWYTFWPAHKTQIFFGHWAALVGNTGREDVIGLDTGCVWGESLTLYDINRQQQIQVPALKR